jgi:hypothetical protein
MKSFVVSALLLAAVSAAPVVEWIQPEETPAATENDITSFTAYTTADTGAS